MPSLGAPLTKYTPELGMTPIQGRFKAKVERKWVHFVKVEAVKMDYAFLH
jgi:hypothetical protein